MFFPKVSQGALRVDPHKSIILRSLHGSKNYCMIRKQKGKNAMKTFNGEIAAQLRSFG
jgi:hypothetical protein